MGSIRKSPVASMSACAMLDVVTDDPVTREIDGPDALAAPRSDADLLAAVAAGDRDRPLRELYQRYAGRVYGLGVQLLSDRGLAEELVQETFVRLWRSAGLYEPSRGSPATFIFTIARRLAIDLWRRPSSRAPDPEQQAAPTEDQIERLVTRLGVRDALDSLSEAHRQVLELSYRDQLKQTEIAERLGIPLGTVKTRSHHALRLLKSELQRRDING
jgi:RNA polymerase sigma-70 factor (ECF subfamily)